MRIHVMELREGDLLTEPAFNTYGLHILSESTILYKDEIEKNASRKKSGIRSKPKKNSMLR
jgi:hypothetical protein